MEFCIDQILSVWLIAYNNIEMLLKEYVICNYNNL